MEGWSVAGYANVTKVKGLLIFTPSQHLTAQYGRNVRQERQSWNESSQGVWMSVVQWSHRHLLRG